MLTIVMSGRQDTRRGVLKGLLAGVGSLTVPAGNAVAHADLRSISYGETKTGELDGGDPLYRGTYPAEPVQFTGEAGDEVVVEAASGDLCGLFLGIVDPAGTLIYEYGMGWGSDGWTGYAGTLLRSGAYTIWVGPYPVVQYGAYELTLRQTGTDHLLESGESVTERLETGDTDWEGIETATGTIETPSVFDLYSLPGTAGQRVQITVESAEFVPKLFVAPSYAEYYIADVGEGTKDSSDNEATLTHTFALDGNLEIGVTATESDATGEYELSTRLREHGSTDDHREIVIEAKSDEASYELEVSGSILSEDDETVSGTVEGNEVDDYQFTGDGVVLEITEGIIEFRVRGPGDDASEDREELPNTVTVEGLGETVEYRFSVSGTVEMGPDAETEESDVPADEVTDGKRVTGYVHAHGDDPQADDYHYSGSIRFRRAEAEVRIELDVPT